MKSWIYKLPLAACLAGPGLAPSAFAQYAPNPQCAAPQYCAPNCYRPCPTNATPQGEPVNPPGMFVAPPASGEVQGESNSLGVHGPALRIPESIIRLPTIQMPSMVKYRRNPEMHTDSARATFQSQPAGARLQFARPQAAPANAAPQGEPVQPNCNQPVMVPCAPWCAQNGAPNGAQAGAPATDDVARLQQQVAQLTAVVGQLAAMQQNAATPAPVQPAGFQNGAVRPMSYEAPRPQPSAAELQAQAQYDQKCKELAEMQEQLAAVQWEYQALLEAKQQQIAQQRDARLRRQLGDTSETPVTRPVSQTTVEPARSAEPAAPATRAPLRLRGRSATTSPEETLEHRQPQAAAAQQSMIQPVSAEEEVVDEPAAPVQESGSRLGRWFKRSK